MEIRKFNGMEDWSIVNDSGWTRSGFYHESILIHYGHEIERAKVNYINRTWECYTFQTSMQEVVNKKIATIKDVIIEQYKNENGIARLTKKHKSNVEEIINQNESIIELQEIKKQLEFSR